MVKKNEKVRVVAYARVSTLAQVNDGNSLENQRTYFQRELSKNKNYQLVSLPTNNKGVYADKGISGTKLKRPAFDLMLKDAGLQPVVSAYTDQETDDYEIVAEPKFDLIFVKDITRFARNVSVDKLLKTLLKNNVVVYFLDLGKRTDNIADFTYIQMFFSFGERESRDRSMKVKFGKAERRRQGDIFVGGNRLYGYNYVKINKHDRSQGNYLVIDEKEAEIVRLIYDLYTEEGLGDSLICQRLYDLGYRNRSKHKFTDSTISRILKNEKYTGVNDAGKYSTVDLFTRQQVNVSYDDADRVMARKATQKLAENGNVKIPAIISVEQFEKAQAIRATRVQERGLHKGMNTGTTPFARKIVCGSCGSFYIAHAVKKDKNGNRYNRRYACRQHMFFNNDDIHQCWNPNISESKLIDTLNSPDYYRARINAYDEVLGAGELCITTLTDAINRPAEDKTVALKNERDSLSEKKQKLLDLYLDSVYTKQELDTRSYEIDNRIKQVDEQIQLVSKSNDEIQDLIKLIKELMTEAETEQRSLKDEFLKGKDDTDIRKKLRNIDCIYIDDFGEPTMIFKTETELNRVVNYIDNITTTYKH